MPDPWQRRLKLLDVATIAFFAVFPLLAVFLDAGDLQWFEDYSQAVSSGMLALLVPGSLACTAADAREWISTGRERTRAHSPRQSVPLRVRARGAA